MQSLFIYIVFFGFLTRFRRICWRLSIVDDWGVTTEGFGGVRGQL